MALKPSSWMRYSTMPKSCDSALGPCHRPATWRMHSTR